jgi:hypothetical protein
MADTTTGAQTDPRSFVAHCLVRLGYSHNKAEQLMQAALDQHAHELAEQIRERFRTEFSRATANLGVAPAQRWIQGGDQAADLIDPAAAGPTS